MYIVGLLYLFLEVFEGFLTLAAVFGLVFVIMVAVGVL